MYRRRAQNAPFSAAWDTAIDQAVELLEAEARRRAAVGVEEPVYSQGAVVGHVRKYSDVLLIFLLKAHRPRVYRDHVQVEHSGDVELRDRHVTITLVDPAERQAQSLREQAEARAVAVAEAERLVERSKPPNAATTEPTTT